MKMPAAAYYGVLVVLAVLLWREIRTGVLQPLDESLLVWMGEIAAPGGEAKRGPTLVFQGGVTGAELSSLDIGLFVRAVSRLGARVVAVAAYEFDVSQLGLEVRPGADTSYIAGSLLLPRTVGSGLGPEVLPAVQAGGWTGDNFAGSYSTFPVGRGWRSGFLNLPSAAGPRNSLPVVARLRGQPVPSFALAIYLAFQDGGNGWASAVEGSATEGLRLGQWVLPVDAEGMIPLRSDALRHLRRLDMDDLLLEVERVEQGRPPNPDVVELIEGRIAILGTLLAGPGDSIRLHEGRQLSLAEFQGMGVVTLFHSLRLPRLPWWAELLAVAVTLALASLLRCVSRDQAVAIFGAATAGFFLCGFLITQQYAIIPPILLPCCILLGALILRWGFSKKTTA